MEPPPAPMVVISIMGERITRPKSMVACAASSIRPPVTSDTSKLVPPRSQVMAFSKPAARAMAAAAITPAAGPDSAVRAGMPRAVAVDMMPPFDCTMWKRPPKPPCRQRAFELAEIVRHDRLQIGVERGGGGALEFADLRQDLGGDADMRRRPDRAHAPPRRPASFAALA